MAHIHLATNRLATTKRAPAAPELGYLFEHPLTEHPESARRSAAKKRLRGEHAVTLGLKSGATLTFYEMMHFLELNLCKNNDGTFNEFKIVLRVILEGFLRLFYPFFEIFQNFYGALSEKATKLNRKSTW